MVVIELLADHAEMIQTKIWTCFGLVTIFSLFLIHNLVETKLFDEQLMSQSTNGPFI